MLYFFALVQELIDRPSYINEQLLEHDAYISCLQLKKVNVAHDAMHNNYLYNHTAYYHVLQQVIAFLVTLHISEPRHDKTCIQFMHKQRYRVDQHLCFRYKDSTIPLPPKTEFSRLWPSSVAVQPGLCRTWSKITKTGFLATRLIH